MTNHHVICNEDSDRHTSYRFAMEKKSKEIFMIPKRNERKIYSFEKEDFTVIEILDSDNIENSYFLDIDKS